MTRPPLAELLDLAPHPEGGWFRETWHRVRSAELWLWHRGGPLTLTLEGELETATRTLGPDVENGQLPQVLVPPNVWQCARPAGDTEVLVSCVVVPGFDFADFDLSQPAGSG